MAVTADVVVTELRADTAAYDQRIAASATQFEKRMGDISRAANRVGGSGRNVQDFGNKVQKASANTANLAAQINDIGVQLAGGQSPFLIAVQQGTQINQALGQTGARGAVAALAGAFSSLLNPVSLATLGIIGFGGAAIQYLTQVLFATEDTAKAIENQNKIIRAAADAWGDSLPALKTYTDELERIEQLGNAQDAIQTVINRGFIDLKDVASDAAGSLGEIVSSFREANVSGDQIYNLLQSRLVTAVNTYEQALRDGSDTTQEMADVQDVLADAMSVAIATGSNDAIRSINNYMKALAEAAKNTRVLIQEFNRLQAMANAPEGTGSRLQSRADVIRQESIFGPGGRFEGTNELPEDIENILNPPRDRAGERRADEIEREKQAVVDLIDQLEFERSLISMTNVEREKANALRKAGAAATPEQRARIEELAAAIYNENEAIKAQQQAYEELQRIGEQALTSLGTAFADGKLEASEMIQIIIRLTQQLLTMKNLGAISGGGGFFGFLGNLFGGGGFAASDYNLLGNVGMYANGTNYAPGGLAIVGERGPELLNLPRGSRVMNATQTRQAIGGAQITYAPVYHVAEGADPAAIAQLRQAQIEDRRQFTAKVQESITELQRRGRI